MANFVRIDEIVIGSTIKTAYKNENAESSEIFFKERKIKEVNIDEKCVITEDGSKIYGMYANNSYFNIIK